MRLLIAAILLLGSTADAKPKPKPKPLAARVTCFATKDDDRIDLPDKQQRSLDGYTVQCFVDSKDPRFGGMTVKLWAQTAYVAPTTDDTDGHRTSERRAGHYEDGEDESGFLVAFDPDDVPICLGRFDIRIWIDDLTGAHLFTKTMTVKQHC